MPATSSNGAQRFQRPHPAAADVGRLLDGHEPGAGPVAVAGRSHRGLHLRRGEDAPVAVEHVQHRAGQRRRARRPRTGPDGTCGRGSPRRRPGRTCSRNAIALHIVPEGRNSAASLPSSSATRSCSAFTVGSSKRCSSPTSASAIARRIASVGPRLRVAEEVDRHRRAAPMTRERLGHERLHALAPDVQRKVLEHALARRRRARRRPAASARSIAAASCAGSCPSTWTPTSPTTSGSAPARVVTGMQPASIASATERPKPSCDGGLHVHGGAPVVVVQHVLLDPAGERHVRGRRLAQLVRGAVVPPSREHELDVGQQGGRPHERPQPLALHVARGRRSRPSARCARASLRQLAERVGHAVVHDRHPARVDARRSRLPPRGCSWSWSSAASRGASPSGETRRIRPRPCSP